MSLSRRAFLIGAAACACAPVAGCAGNPAPQFDANADRTLPLPDALRKPGAQAKIKLPESKNAILVWRTEIGFGGVQLQCSHCGMEIAWKPKEGVLQCLVSGCEYALDGSVKAGPKRPALRAYVVELDGERLRILG